MLSAIITIASFISMHDNFHGLATAYVLELMLLASVVILINP